MKKKNSLSAPKLPNLQDKEMNMEEWISNPKKGKEEKEKTVPEIEKVHKHVHKRTDPVAATRKK